MIRPAMQLLAAMAMVPALAHAQWARTYEQFYYPAPDNWVFRTEYPGADRLFNAFDYGHAILYELLYTRPAASPAILEETQYDFLTTRLLVSPPRLPLKEMAIMPHYTRLAPEAKQMFEWAHILHRQVYDVLADERLDDARRDARLQELTRYYLSRRDLAFSTRPKSMALMQEQFYSLAFRERYPKFNGLIWGYHWLQVGLYEPLVAGRSRAERQAGVGAAVARFRQMLTDPPRTLPYQMPMTTVIAPIFAQRYPELAIIFDNLHSMHDVISDILASDKVPKGRKRAEILLAAERYRDDTTEVMSVEGWRRMSDMMGLQNMGGSAVGFLSELPTPTVARGLVMRHDKDGNMIGDAHEGHGAAMPVDSAAKDAHAGHVMPTPVADPHADHVLPAAPPDSAGALAAARAFHAALATSDSLGALALLLDDAIIQEAGRLEEKQGYRSGHLAADIAFAAALPAVRSGWKVRMEGVTAWVTSTSSTTGEYRGRQVDSIGQELMVLRHGDGGWRIASIHWSSRTRPSR
ncbi:MAG: nuclear transport factor 2 family protein [Gemmatimonadetes bacterium]|nr:nuclear transport factor 2 family protein [Gemmatimonadota bacterium]MCC6771387.1 nuclear transport factor 2 family protein [Gemmatimonadaceae bacterium]